MNIQVVFRGVLVILSLASFCSLWLSSNVEGNNDTSLRGTGSLVDMSKNVNQTTNQSTAPFSGSHAKSFGGTTKPHSSELRLLPPFFVDQLKPVQVMEQYKKWHGVDALAWDGHNPERKYALGVYWCPDRVGNVIHSLYNSMAWAMITNRTLLLHWDDTNPTQNG